MVSGAPRIKDAHHALVFSQPRFADFPVAVGKHIVAMDRYSRPIIVQTIHKVKSTWKPLVGKKFLRNCVPTSKEDHPVTELRVQNVVNDTLWRIVSYLSGGVT